MQIKNKIQVFDIKELIQMKWQEVREMYPNQFVKFEIVEYHEYEKTKYVDEVAIIKAIKDGREAMKEFTKCKNGQLVYSTENESIVIEKIKHIGIRSNFSPSDFRSIPGGICEGRMTELVKENRKEDISIIRLQLF